MNAIKIEKTVDEATAKAIPELRPLLGKRIELIALQTEPANAQASTRTFTVDEFLATKLVPPPGVGPVSLDDMEKAIEKGAR